MNRKSPTIDSVLSYFKHTIFEFAQCGLYDIEVSPNILDDGTLWNYEVIARCYTGIKCGDKWGEDRDFSVTAFVYVNKKEIYINTAMPLEDNMFNNPVEKAFSDHGFMDMNFNSFKCVLI